MPHRAIDILLVEDEPGDIRLAGETLREYKMQNTVHVVRDGEDALAFLRKQGRFANERTPDLILVDLALPKIDGVEVIAELHKDPVLKDIPVVVLAASPLDRELLKNFNVPADCFIVKPLTLERFIEAVCCFPGFGLSIVQIASA